MKYHKQEHLYIPGDPLSKGSCYPTAIACVLDLELHQVPYFHLCYWRTEEKKNLSKIYSDRYLQGKHISEVTDQNEIDNFNEKVHAADRLWDIILTTWLESQGYVEEFITDIDQWLKDNPDAFYFASGLSSRGVSHIVIYQNGKLHHDPHPSDEGLASLYKSPYTFLKKVV